jgi:ribose transport system substrate-binding protein
VTALIGTLSFSGCAGALEEAVTSAVEEAAGEVESAVEEMAAEVEEGVEEVAEEVVEEDKDVIDPFILEIREGLDAFRGEINYKGEYGATPTWDTELFLTVAEVEQIRQGNPETGEPWKVGYVMDASGGSHTTSMLKAMNDVFDYLNMEFLGEVDPQYDPAAERAGAENWIAAGADVVIGAPINPEASAESFRPVLDAGKDFVIWSNIPAGYEYGKDYVGVSSAMAEDLGKLTLELLKEGVTEPTEVAFIYMDMDFWVVNLIDDMARAAIEADPNLEIVEELGYALEAEAFDLMTAAIQRHPDIKRAYGNYFLPAAHAADACVQLGRDDIKIACFAIDEPTLVSILTDGNVIGTVSDNPYQLGANLAILAGFGVIDKQAPEFTITPAIPFDKENLVENWELTQKIPLPDSIADLL